MDKGKYSSIESKEKDEKYWKQFSEYIDALLEYQRKEIASALNTRMHIEGLTPFFLISHLYV